MYSFLITGEHDVPKIKIPIPFYVQSPFRVFWLLRQYKRLERCEKLKMLENTQIHLSKNGSDEKSRYLFARKVAGWTICWMNLFRQGKALCLERAIIICSMLRYCGLPAQVVIGRKLSFSMSERYPFHAWVELDGRPVDEHIGVHSQYIQVDVFPS